MSPVEIAVKAGPAVRDGEMLAGLEPDTGA